MIHRVKYQVLNLLSPGDRSYAYRQALCEKLADEYASKGYWFAGMRANWAAWNTVKLFQHFEMGVLTPAQLAEKLSNYTGIAISETAFAELFPGAVETHQSNKDFWENLSRDLHEDSGYQKALIIPSAGVHDSQLLDKIAKHFHFGVTIKGDQAIFDNSKDGLHYYISQEDSQAAADSVILAADFTVLLAKIYGATSQLTDVGGQPNPNSNGNSIGTCRAASEYAGPAPSAPPSEENDGYLCEATPVIATAVPYYGSCSLPLADASYAALAAAEVVPSAPSCEGSDWC